MGVFSVIKNMWRTVQKANIRVTEDSRLTNINFEEAMKTIDKILAKPGINKNYSSDKKSIASDKITLTEEKTKYTGKQLEEKTLTLLEKTHILEQKFYAREITSLEAKRDDEIKNYRNCKTDLKDAKPKLKNAKSGDEISHLKNQIINLEKQSTDIKCTLKAIMTAHTGMLSEHNIAQARVNYLNGINDLIKNNEIPSRVKLTRAFDLRITLNEKIAEAVKTKNEVIKNRKQQLSSQQIQPLQQKSRNNGKELTKAV